MLKFNCKNEELITKYIEMEAEVLGDPVEDVVKDIINEHAETEVEAISNPIDDFTGDIILSYFEPKNKKDAEDCRKIILNDESTLNDVLAALKDIAKRKNEDTIKDREANREGIESISTTIGNILDEGADYPGIKFRNAVIKYATEKNDAVTKKDFDRELSWLAGGEDPDYGNIFAAASNVMYKAYVDENLEDIADLLLSNLEEEALEIELCSEDKELLISAVKMYSDAHKAE